MTEHIETERCRLAALELADRENVGALYRCGETRRYLGGALDEQSFGNRFSHMLGDNEGRHWTILTREGLNFVGLVSLNPHHDGLDFEIAYQILPSFWGQGLARETVDALIGYASSVLGLPKLLAETQAVNLRSRRLLERLGMTELRTVKRFGAEQVIYQRVFSRSAPLLPWKGTFSRCEIQKSSDQRCGR